ncbi:MAG: nucleotidyltransferase domain-containing protein [Planctomycetes bacterium]|uniref:nucleotidyltransferase domain-containing protein n=1 Tax=Candidatus Wunengus sp. YC65 TaxID=3367701 RepID=UPI001DE5A0F3|nr:nucleotidyltransferase domain-containing protein [Planctomycetota bacterium]MBI5794743.1 nucleotidyltransferase domain-containing protein [Planctomycetota bacterium]
MIKFERLPENISHLLPNVREYLNKHPKVVFAYLFGGLARGRVSPLSDVDIAIYAVDGADIVQERKDDFQGEGKEWDKLKKELGIK